MPLNQIEKMLLEAVTGMLDDVAGTYVSKDKTTEHTFTHLHEEIEQAYRLATVSLEHHDSVCSAFSKIHSHKYIDDPSFGLSFKKELMARAIPLTEQEDALQAIGKVIDKYLKGNAEQDSGWHPQLDEIIDASQPQQIDESKQTPALENERKFYQDPKVRKWLNDKPEFWESVNHKITPLLEEMGYDCSDQKAFWEAYDDISVEYVVRDDLHDLFEELHVNYIIENRKK